MLLGLTFCQGIYGICIEPTLIHIKGAEKLGAGAGQSG
jgi:hypothetical protein